VQARARQHTLRRCLILFLHRYGSCSAFCFLAALLFLRTLIVQKGKRWDLEGSPSPESPSPLGYHLCTGPMLILYFLSAASLGATAVCTTPTTSLLYMYIYINIHIYVLYMYVYIYISSPLPHHILLLSNSPTPQLFSDIRHGSSPLPHIRQR